MKKSEVTERRIYTYLLDHPGSSAPQIGSALDLTRVTAFLYLQKLMRTGKVLSTGAASSTRYFIDTRVNMDFSVTKASILEYIIHRIKDDFGEEIYASDTEDMFSRYFLFIDSQDRFLVGIDGFIAWCMNSNRNYMENIREKALEYFNLVGSIEYLRNKNGFFDGTESVRANLKEYTHIGMDRCYFHDIFNIPNSFGRTRTAMELAFGKQNGDMVLLEHAMNNSLDPIHSYIIKNTVDAIIYTPPTQGRNIQFRDVLERKLALQISKIHAEKIRSPDHILRAQKDIRDRKNRIANAEQSIVVDIPKNLLTLSHILILDDSFTTGATPNAIALKIREAGYKGKITVITICGSFNYDLAITEDEI